MLMLLPLLSTQVMGAWGYSKQANALDKMEAILRRMETEYEATQEPDVRPNTVSYVTVRQNNYTPGVLVFLFVVGCPSLPSNANLNHTMDSF